MNRLLLTGMVVLLWMISGCSNKDQAPGDIISKEKMEAVLWDMIQAERFTSTFVSKDSSKNIKMENFRLYSQVFSIHDITREEFIKSYQFYLSRPDIARVMFDSLSSRANRVREDLYKPQEPAKVDSSKQAPPAQKTDSLHARFRDSLIRNGRRRKSDLPLLQPKLMTPDTTKATVPKPAAPKAVPSKPVSPGAGKANQPMLLDPGKVKNTQSKLFATDTGKSTQPRRPIRPNQLRIRDSLQRHP